MTVSLSNHNNIYMLVSYCAPLAGGGIGVALFLCMNIATEASSGHVDIVNALGFFVALLIARLGLPKRLIVDNNKNTFTFEIIGFIGKKYIKGEKSSIKDITVDNGDDKPVTGMLLSKRGHRFYIYNVCGYLLSPERHNNALREIKKIW